jgi:hypothetical protein
MLGPINARGLKYASGCGGIINLKLLMKCASSGALNRSYLQSADLRKNREFAPVLEFMPPVIGRMLPCFSTNREVD